MNEIVRHAASLPAPDRSVGVVGQRHDTPTIQQLAVRQQITEAVVAASLDLDSVLAEIASEHARLMELSSVL